MDRKSIDTKKGDILVLSPGTRHRLAMEIVRATKTMDKTMDAFLAAMEGKKVKNPDTGRMVLYKSLKGPKGQDLLQTDFEKWKGTDNDAPQNSSTTDTKPQNNQQKHEEYAKSWEKKRKTWDLSQKDALYAYTDTEYSDINNQLRGVGASTKIIRGRIHVLDELFRSESGKTSEDVVSFRKVEMDHPLSQLAASGKLKAGMTYEDPGYMSTTIDMDAFKKNDTVNSQPYTLKMDVPSGTQGVYLGAPPADYSRFPKEKELLLNRGTKVEIVKVEGRVIHCRVISK